jgi:hypothetical protein
VKTTRWSRFDPSDTTKIRVGGLAWRLLQLAMAMLSSDARILAAVLALTASCKSASRAETPPENVSVESVPAPSTEEPAPAPPPDDRPPRVVLVTIDGVRWQDVFDGGDPSLAHDHQLDAFADPDALVPRLRELGARGIALGAGTDGCGVVRTHGTSNISLPGYLELLSGRATSCRSNACARIDTPTILDDARRSGIERVASISSWETLERAATHGSEGVLVAAGARPWPVSTATELAMLSDRGMQLGPFPAPGGAYRPDSATTAIALAYLRAESPQLLHVGLGDTDEWAHRGRYDEYLDALHDADAFVGDVVDWLDHEGLLDVTTILVTTDHGRGRDFRSHGAALPESRRTFLIAAGRGVTSAGERCARHDVELPDIGASIRTLLGLAPDPRPSSGTPIVELTNL